MARAQQATIPSSGPRRVRRKVLADEVYELVRAMLLDDGVEPGTRVSIDGLARELDVSPTPVREVLARLEAEGLVVKRALSGYTTAPLLDARAFEELFDMRELLEPAAAERAARRITSDELDRLAADAGAPSGTTEDHPTFSARDAAFHRTIHLAAGNQLLVDTITRLRPHNQIHRLYVHSGLAEETEQEHLAIVAALRERDARGAAKAMRQHIRASRKRLVEAVYALDGGDADSR